MSPEFIWLSSVSFVSSVVGFETATYFGNFSAAAPGRYIGRMEATRFQCAICEKDEKHCTCDRYCAICFGEDDARLCQDGCYYCRTCREACDYQAQD